MEYYKRRLTPPELTRYQGYLQYVRTEFRFRCAYCSTHEHQLRLKGAFHLDHFRPASLFPQLKASYRNLYYACVDCNLAKRNCWPSDTEEALDYTFIDPCVESLTGRHAKLVTAKDGRGRLLPKTRPGMYTIQRIRLNRYLLVDKRKREIEERLALALNFTQIARQFGRVQEVAARISSLVPREDAIRLQQEMRAAEEEVEQLALECLLEWQPRKRPHDEP